MNIFRKKKTEKQTIGTIALLCKEVSEQSKNHAFFDYSGHTNTFAVHIYVDGWDKEKDAIYFNGREGISSVSITQTNIDEACEFLRGFLNGEV